MTVEQIVTRNRKVCLWLSFLRALFLSGSVINIYYTGLGLSQTEVFALQTVLNIVLICFDMPFGNLADRIGIRKVTIIGSALMLVEGLSFMWCHTFWQFTPVLVLTGLCTAAQNNTTKATMALSYRMLADEDPGSRKLLFDNFLAKEVRVRFAGQVVASLTGSLLIWQTSIVWTIWLQPIIWLAHLMVARLLIEPTVEHNTGAHLQKGQLRTALRLMLVKRKDIRYATILHSVLFTVGYLMAWLRQPKLVQAGLPVWAAGVTGAVTWAVIAYSGGWAKRFWSEQAVGTWVFVVISMTVGLAWGGFRGGVDGLAAVMVSLAIYLILAPQLFDSFLNERLPDHGATRNTELAVASTIPTLACMLLAPCIGWLVDATTLDTALLALGLGLALASGTCLVLLIRELHQTRASQGSRT